MTYSCSDFTDTVLDVLEKRGVLLLPYDPDSPSEQADAALDAIERLAKQRNDPHTIDAVTWQETGSPDDPRSRLLAQITVCGLAMHLEAYAIKNDPHIGQTAADPYFNSEWDGICALNIDCPFQTLEIDGREYVLIAQPHGD